MKVVQLKNDKGNVVQNHFIIYSPDDTRLQSYQSIIVRTTFEDGKRVIYLDADKWDYSKTTAKYRNLYLGMTTKEIKAKIASGDIKLTDLN